MRPPLQKKVGATYVAPTWQFIKHLPSVIEHAIGVTNQLSDAYDTRPETL